MSALEWKQLDEYTFVCLVADLLRSLGFVDLRIHGDGPDGGLDLVATELVSFALHKAKPFTWGVQCKYSIEGRRRAVSTREVRDIEGVLRSERYSSHDLRGYLLVTNRRVSQTIVERLLGIDRRSPFRADWLDGERLSRLLKDRPSLLDKYFGHFAGLIASLGTPIAVGDLPANLQRPVIPVTLYGPTGTAKVQAILDTAAMMSVFSETAVEQLGPLPYDLRRVRGVAGQEIMLRSVFLTMRIGDASFVDTRIVLTPEAHSLIGCDILNGLTLMIDGPNRIVKLWQTGIEREGDGSPANSQRLMQEASNVALSK